MQSELIFNIGIVIAGVAVIAGVVSVIVLRSFKIRLNKQLDNEFGKRRD